MKWIDKFKKARQMKKKDIDETIQRIREASEKAKPGSEEFKRLRADLEQELKNKKLYKEMRFAGISPDKIMFALLILVIAGFGFALDLESPKAMKIASFIFKLPGFKI